MSETVKHTPGPWEVFEGGNFVRIVAAGYHEGRKATKSGYLGGELSVAEANYAPTKNYDSDHAKAMANGHLIAAAPELLEALQALFVDYAESEGCYCGQIIGGTSQGEPLGKCGYCIAEKAIKKAGGTFIPRAGGR